MKHLIPRKHFKEINEVHAYGEKIRKEVRAKLEKEIMTKGSVWHEQLKGYFIGLVAHEKRQMKLEFADWLEYIMPIYHLDCEHCREKVENKIKELREKANEL